ncbi:hypothetical protein HMPREF1212_01601 [Parabacteroides sp. HGS0025]|uniref:alpha/beta fold hydrolase n=1 Tax=Parabacteroides sp. HGS0025 TaxID=1078087 RepID=UPI0006177312|nr:alpha/beta hydrolase [Parabacteroides sp. HGS0025]KKB50874.1 hypothetical protein HMPREF1212_01601 [Parabacteroides sp. HGS0025]
MKRLIKVISIVLLSVAGLLLIGVLSVLCYSSGKLDKLTDSHGKVIENAIAEKGWLDIGGIKQGYFLRGENPDNPILLFLHGGPGSPELPLCIADEKDERLEKYFTVCYWDQRGAGMTFSPDTDLAGMTVEQFIEDTRQVTEYLCKRFGQGKIYLMGHSWGSYLGIKTIGKYPELYKAYFGIGQVSDQLQSERAAYDYMLDQAQERGDKSAVKSLSKWDKNAAGFPSNDYLFTTRSLLMNEYGIGIKHENSSMIAVMMDLLYFKGYTFGEKINYLRGTMFSTRNMFGNVLNDNLFESSISFDIPVYIIQGKYDYQVSYRLAKEYSERISAPEKGFYTMENSAHSPNLEEPERFVEIVRSCVQ